MKGLILAMKKKRNSIVLVLALIIVFSGCQKQSDIKTEIPAVTGTFDFTVLKAVLPCFAELSDEKGKVICLQV